MGQTGKSWATLGRPETAFTPEKEESPAQQGVLSGSEDGAEDGIRTRDSHLGKVPGTVHHVHDGRFRALQSTIRPPGRTESTQLVDQSTYARIRHRLHEPGASSRGTPDSSTSRARQTTVDSNRGRDPWRTSRTIEGSARDSAPRPPAYHRVTSGSSWTIAPRMSAGADERRCTARRASVGFDSFGPMIVDRLDIDAGAFEAATGWQIKPEGACKGDVCVPLDRSAGAAGRFDLVTTADRLGMAIVADAEAGLWSIGPESLGGRSLATAVAPELSLPDVLTGADVKLSSFLGQKVVLAVWAPY